MKTSLQSPPLEADIFAQDASSASLSGFREAHEGFYLADPTATERFYVSHSISLTTGIRLKGGSASMMVTFGLMEEPPPNASQATLAGLHSCTLGSIEIRHSGDPEAPTQTFTGQFRIPRACVKSGSSSTRFNIWVASDVEGAVKTVDSEKSTPKIVVYDEAYLKANNICLQLRKDGPCVTAIQVDESPGLNANLKQMATSSSVATFDPNFTEGEGSVISLVTVNSEAFVEGVAEDDPSLADYELQVRYEICASRTANPQGDDPNCSRTSTEWSALQIQDPASPNGQLRMIDTQTIKNLKPGAPIGFSASIFARGTTFNRLKDPNDWGQERSFLIRQCVKPYKGGSLVEQKNISFQAANADATLDDCRVAAIIMADVRPTPSPTSKPVCVDGSGNPGTQSFAPPSDCIPASQINEPAAFTNEDAFGLAANQEKTFDLGFRTDMWWGKRGLVQIHLPAHLIASAGAKGATYEGYQGSYLHGIWGPPLQLVHQGMNGTVPYEGRGFN